MLVGKQRPIPPPATMNAVKGNLITKSSRKTLKPIY